MKRKGNSRPQTVSPAGNENCSGMHNRLVIGSSPVWGTIFNNTCLRLTVLCLFLRVLLIVAGMGTKL